MTRADIQTIAQRIAGCVGPEKIILFGSHARGAATEGSDVDLLIIAESNQPRHRRAVPIYKLLGDVPDPIDVLVYTPNEVQDWCDVPQAIVSRALREGEVLYEKPA